MAALEPRVPVPMDAIHKFCKTWKITEFALSGSVLRDDFRPDSGIDVMVTLADETRWSLWDFIDMQEELQRPFGQNVDLVERGTVRNPFHRYHIMKGRRVLHAA